MRIKCCAMDCENDGVHPVGIWSNGDEVIVWKWCDDHYAEAEKFKEELGLEFEPEEERHI